VQDQHRAHLGVNAAVDSYTKHVVHDQVRPVTGATKNVLPCMPWPVERLPRMPWPDERQNSTTGPPGLVQSGNCWASRSPTTRQRRCSTMAVAPTKPSAALPVAGHQWSCSTCCVVVQHVHHRCNRVVWQCCVAVTVLMTRATSATTTSRSNSLLCSSILATHKILHISPTVPTPPSTGDCL
jgi:hypothetical protein